VTHQRKIAVIGLGYVGLPVAAAFARSGAPVVGFDVDRKRIEELRAGIDRTREVEKPDLSHPTLIYTDDPVSLAEADFYIVTVPTPIDAARRPDLGAVFAASRTVGRALKRGDIVVYESTVYPGAVEDECVPLLERASGLRCGTDFTVGYSPERINPGDKQHRFETITKVVSGQDEKTLRIVAEVYGSVVKAGIHCAPSIRVAEAAKVIENTQRDVNIALVNELALIFKRLGIDTEEVLQAAGTKWNFLPFRPGLVGGHCIGVDPYYLTHKATEIGYHPEMILAGRRLNDNMGSYVASEVVRLLTRKRIHVNGARVLVLGLTFKENCPDIRNSKVVDVIRELQTFGAKVDVHDPWIDAAEAQHEYGIKPVRKLRKGHYDAAIIAVAHREFKAMGPAAVRQLCRRNHVLFDIKYLFPADEVDGRL
jgi:UDP-N-acetyl-D-galactosamine dehydrogenase